MKEKLRPEVAVAARELPPGARRLLLLGVGLFCLVAAYAPLWKAGFTGDDMDLLLRASGHLAAEDGEPLRAYDAPLPLIDMPPLDVIGIVGNDTDGDVGSLLSGYSLAASLRLYGARPESIGGAPTAVLYRAENLVLLLFGSIGLWALLRRVFRPFVGAEQAGVAATTSAYLFFLHPLCVPAVASVSGRSDLLALAFSTWAAAAFLRGRQNKLGSNLAASAVLALLASLAGQLALLLPFALALVELACVHRYLPLRRRARTALLTFLAFLALTQLNALVVSSMTGHGFYPQVGLQVARLADPVELLRAILYMFEKLGVLLLPSNTSTLGLLGVLFAGVLLLLALQPALVAARSAPRLWGWSCVWWVSAIGVALLFGLHERVRLENLAQARTLLPAAAATCAGLGMAITAVHGLTRFILPPIVALGFALLANGNARPWASGSALLRTLRENLTAGAETGGSPLWIVDPPREVQGLDPIGVGLPHLLHPLLAAPDAQGRRLRTAVDVREVSSEILSLAVDRGVAAELFGEEALTGVEVEEQGRLWFPAGETLGTELDRLEDDVELQVSDAMEVDLEVPIEGRWRFHAIAPDLGSFFSSAAQRTSKGLSAERSGRYVQAALESGAARILWRFQRIDSPQPPQVIEGRTFGSN